MMGDPIDEDVQALETATETGEGEPASPVPKGGQDADVQGLQPSGRETNTEAQAIHIGFERALLEALSQGRISQQAVAVLRTAYSQFSNRLMALTGGFKGGEQAQAGAAHYMTNYLVPAVEGLGSDVATRLPKLWGGAINEVLDTLEAEKQKSTDEFYDPWPVISAKSQQVRERILSSLPQPLPERYPEDVPNIPSDYVPGTLPPGRVMPTPGLVARRGAGGELTWVRPEEGNAEITGLAQARYDVQRANEQNIAGRRLYDKQLIADQAAREAPLFGQSWRNLAPQIGPQASGNQIGVGPTSAQEMLRQSQMADPNTRAYMGARASAGGLAERYPDLFEEWNAPQAAAAAPREAGRYIPPGAPAGYQDYRIPPAPGGGLAAPGGTFEDYLRKKFAPPIMPRGRSVFRYGR